MDRSERKSYATLNETTGNYFCIFTIKGMNPLCTEHEPMSCRSPWRWNQTYRPVANIRIVCFQGFRNCLWIKKECNNYLLHSVRSLMQEIILTNRPARLFRQKPSVCGCCHPCRYLPWKDLPGQTLAPVALLHSHEVFELELWSLYQHFH